jgi:hypothetical protein
MERSTSRPIIGPRSITSASPNDLLFANWPGLEQAMYDLPIEFHELNEKKIDRHSDVVVYIYNYYDRAPMRTLME